MENSKFFRNGKTFSAFCRMRYGASKKIWDDPTLWKKVGKYAIEFDIEAADKKFDHEEAANEAEERDPIEVWDSMRESMYN